MTTCLCGPLLTNSNFHLLKMLVYDVISFGFSTRILFPAVFTVGTTVRPQGGTFVFIVSSRIRFLDPSMCWISLSVQLRLSGLSI